MMTTRRGREKSAVDYREPTMAEILAATAAELHGASSSKPSKDAAEDVGAEFDYERDKRVVENEATKEIAGKGRHWVVNNRGLWARLIGRFRLPQDLAKRAARQCAPSLFASCVPSYASLPSWAGCAGHGLSLLRISGI